MTTYQPHEQRVIAEKAELDQKIDKLRGFLTSGTFEALPDEDRSLLRKQIAAMSGYSSILGQRIARFTPQANHPAIAAMQPLNNDGKALDLDDDTPLAPACDLSGDGTCEACQ